MICSSVWGKITFCSLFFPVANFTTNVDAENQTLINHKCVCGALNRHFCQTRVMGSGSFRSKVCRAKFALSPCGCLLALLLFLSWVQALAKKQMCLQMRWLIYALILMSYLLSKKVSSICLSSSPIINFISSSFRSQIPKFLM
jgi:hypothetical protein